MKRIRDVIDWDQAEALLEGHNHHEFGRVRVVRSVVDRGEWIVFYEYLAVQFLEDPNCESTRFDSLAEALEVATSPANLEKWDRLWQERYKPLEDAKQ